MSTLYDRLFTRLRRKDIIGLRSNYCVLTPEEIIQLRREFVAGGFIQLRPGERTLDIPPDINVKSVWGVPIVLNPFTDDPLFKQLQAMAALAGAEITYPVVVGDAPTMAEFTFDGRGWRYVPADGTLTGRSVLYAIDGPFPHGKPSTSLLSHPSYAESAP